MCRERALAYPDCDTMLQDVYDSAVEKEFLAKR
jgi:hypothetical protein